MMFRLTVLAIGLMMTATGAGAATDFGVRRLGGPMIETRGEAAPVATSGGGVRGASRIAAQFGRITSTLRSSAHNRAVGGVPNSYHLRGMAMDLARRPGVAHWQVASALREAGYHLIESLDEGDHSHFALGGARGAQPTPIRPSGPREQTIWGLVELTRSVPREPAS